jgi:hypothetical protein
VLLVDPDLAIGAFVTAFADAGAVVAGAIYAVDVCAGVHNDLIGAKLPVPTGLTYTCTIVAHPVQTVDALAGILLASRKNKYRRQDRK